MYNIISSFLLLLYLHFLLPHLEGSEILVTLKTLKKSNTSDVFKESQSFNNLELSKENELLYELSSHKIH